MYDIKSRLGYIGRRQTQVRGETIQYARGTVSILLDICPGHIDVQNLTPTSIVSEVRYTDFIITASDLVLPGIGLTLPQRGDIIRWNGETYTATPPTDVDGVFNYTNMYKDRLRIHTVLTSVP